MKHLLLLFLLLFTAAHHLWAQAKKKNLADYMDGCVYIEYPLPLKSQIKGIAQLGLGVGFYFNKRERLGATVNIEFGLYKPENRNVITHQNIYLGFKYNIVFNPSLCFSPYLQGGYDVFGTKQTQSQGGGLSAGFELYRVRFGFKCGYKRLFNSSLDYGTFTYPMELNILEFGLVYKFLW